METICSFQLVDLENDYFLVKFRDNEDFHHALTGGPWMIYGHYLTVQPWNYSFSTETDRPKTIVGWVRFPGLPYKFYEKNILKEIASTLGTVCRIDFSQTLIKKQSLRDWPLFLISRNLWNLMLKWQDVFNVWSMKVFPRFVISVVIMGILKSIVETPSMHNPIMLMLIWSDLQWPIKILQIQVMALGCKLRGEIGEGV